MASKQADMNTKLAIRIGLASLRFLFNVFFYVVVVMAVVSLSKSAYDFSYQVFGECVRDEAPGRNVGIEIAKGESTMHIASKLEFNKVIVDKNSFYVKAKLEKANILPGTYVVNSSMSYDEILDIITDLSNSSTSEDE